MTIRYTCIGCESVLKIKDDKAGTKARCPKCRLEFVVPPPDNDDAEVSHFEATLEVAAGSESARIESADSTADDFDPMAILGGTAGPDAGSAGSGTARLSSEPRKFSVAEIMRDFETGKKKVRKAGPDNARPVVSAATSETTGTAAEALSRAYQQKMKRDPTASSSKSLKDIRSAEQRELLVDFFKKKVAPGLLILGLCIFAYFWWKG